MRKLIFIAVMAIAAAAAAQEKPAYDEELAKKLGADEYGMRNYVVVILKTGDKVISGQKERAEILARHMANIERMADEGKLAIAGPFGDNNSEYRGMYIFNVQTVEQAKALAESDPAVISGMMKAEYYPWYGSAALLEINVTHKKIAKKHF